MAAMLGYLGILMGLYLGLVSPIFGVPRQLDLIIIGIFLISFFGVLFLVLTIFLFNLPGVAVPPHLRGRPGALAEWLRKRRS